MGYIAGMSKTVTGPQHVLAMKNEGRGQTGRPMCTCEGSY